MNRSEYTAEGRGKDLGGMPLYGRGREGGGENMGGGVGIRGDSRGGWGVSSSSHLMKRGVRLEEEEEGMMVRS